MPLPPDYLTGKPVEIIDLTERTASAAWKASAKRHMHNYKVLKFYWQEEKRRAEVAEQRVTELEARNHKLMIVCNFAIGAISVVLATMHNVTPTKRTLTKTINKLEDAIK